MFGLKPDEDLSFFIGTTVESVLATWHQVVLSFTGAITLDFATTIRVVVPGKPAEDLSDGRSARFWLIDLIGDTVIAAAGDEDGTLTLTFESGRSVAVYDEDPHFECYGITTPDRQIIV